MSSISQHTAPAKKIDMSQCHEIKCHVITENKDKMGMRKHQNKKEKIPAMIKYEEFL